MGSCLPINYLLVTENNEMCIICYKKILLEKNYIKCNKCSKILHHYCKSKKNNFCPNCKNIDSLFIYNKVLKSNY